jgi:hypothetical protein
VSFPALASVGEIRVRRARCKMSPPTLSGQRAALARSRDAPRAQIINNGLLAEALFPALASMGGSGSQPYNTAGNAAGFVFGRLMVPSQSGCVAACPVYPLDVTNGDDQPAVDDKGNAYLWRSLGTWCVAYAFGTGVSATESSGCGDGVSLVAGASCGVACGVGYTGAPATIACAAEAAAGDATTGQLTCEPGACMSSAPLR